jgi:hypothetical protein
MVDGFRIKSEQVFGIESDTSFIGVKKWSGG